MSAMLIRADLSPVLEQLYLTFVTASSYLRHEGSTVEYGRRTWCDLHVESLGWGLLASVFVLVLLLVHVSGA